TRSFQVSKVIYTKRLLLPVMSNKLTVAPLYLHMHRLVPETRIRFAGKTIPAEKFAIIQSDKYFSRNQKLLLPAIVSFLPLTKTVTVISYLFAQEFMYIWNIFAVIGQSPHLLNPILERIETHLEIEQNNL